MKDNRKYPRKAVELIIKYQINGEYSTIKSTGISQNISEQGFCISHYGELPVGTKIVIRLTHPENFQFLDAEATIIWSEKKYPHLTEYISGIQFLDEDVELRNNILNKLLNA
ncbi:MAG: PilZ domain-containing protein [Spirochaetes bacterium]|nr:PilZ domain-containing protein [Spirochaetota bacterium]